MRIDGKPYRTIWLKEDNPETIQIIDQRQLPHHLVVEDLKTVDEVAVAIQEMWVRGAPLIGATAALGMYIACLEAADSDNADLYINNSAKKLLSTRPTAVNLSWAIKKQLEVIKATNQISAKIDGAKQNALQIIENDVSVCSKIGDFGLQKIEQIASAKKGDAVNILTHCNAGWLACIDWGTATAPIYKAFNKGINVHVWVDETRPRNQGARITAYELGKHGVPYTVITDNAGGLLMQRGMVDMCLVGTDRTTKTGHVANKIGTYLKALAAYDNQIPFYVALPSSTIDWSLGDDIENLPIENRDEAEVKFARGLSNGEVVNALLTPKEARAYNPAFDITPAKLITGLITERGICAASERGLSTLFQKMEK